jgi:hypothetical protein
MVLHAVPRVGRVGRQAGGVACAEGGATVVPELLGRPDLVAWLAQTSDVGVVVAAALAERLDMIGHGGGGDDTLVGAVTAEGLSEKAALALLDPGATAKPFGATVHMTRSRYRNARSVA